MQSSTTTLLSTVGDWVLPVAAVPAAVCPGTHLHITSLQSTSEDVSLPMTPKCLHSVMLVILVTLVIHSSSSSSLSLSVLDIRGVFKPPEC